MQNFSYFLQLKVQNSAHHVHVSYNSYTLSEQVTAKHEEGRAKVGIFEKKPTDVNSVDRHSISNPLEGVLMTEEKQLIPARL